MRLLAARLKTVGIRKPSNNKYADSNFTLMREAYSHSFLLLSNEKFRIFQSLRAKANASFISISYAQRFAQDLKFGAKVHIFSDICKKNHIFYTFWGA